MLLWPLILFKQNTQEGPVQQQGPTHHVFHMVTAKFRSITSQDGLLYDKEAAEAKSLSFLAAIH